jgi:hypothetical protein
MEGQNSNKWIWVATFFFVFAIFEFLATYIIQRNSLVIENQSFLDYIRVGRVVVKKPGKIIVKQVHGVPTNVVAISDPLLPGTYRNLDIPITVDGITFISNLDRFIAFIYENNPASSDPYGTLAKDVLGRPIVQDFKLVDVETN